jgi:adenylate kinase family enzyme
MINIVHTPCKNCGFAIYEGQTQTDCALKYIDVYKEKNQEIIEVYDQEKEFFVINNKKCPGYREQKWFDSLDTKCDTLEDKIEIFHKYNFIHYLLIVNLDSLTKDQFINLCEQISELKIKPSKIILVRYPPINNQEIFPYEYLKQTIDKYFANISWRIQTVVDQSISYEFMVQNIVSVNKKYRFVASLSEHNTDISKIITHANSIVVNDLGSFMVISNANKSCIVFSSIVYRYSMFMDQKNILSDESNYKII